METVLPWPFTLHLTNGVRCNLQLPTRKFPLHFLNLYISKKCCFNTHHIIFKPYSPTSLSRIYNFLVFDRSTYRLMSSVSLPTYSSLFEELNIQPFAHFKLANLLLTKDKQPGRFVAREIENLEFLLPSCVECSIRTLVHK